MCVEVQVQLCFDEMKPKKRFFFDNTSTHQRTKDFFGKEIIFLGQKVYAAPSIVDGTKGKIISLCGSIALCSANWLKLLGTINYWFFSGRSQNLFCHPHLRADINGNELRINLNQFPNHAASSTLYTHSDTSSVSDIERAKGLRGQSNDFAPSQLQTFHANLERENKQIPESWNDGMQ